MRKWTFVLATVALTFAASRSIAQATPKGYAQPVVSPAAIHEVTARCQNDLAGLGIPADILGCRLMEQVAVGVRYGEIAYGGACTIRIGARPAAQFVLCDSDLSGFGALYSGGFVDSQAWMESFIRKNCF